MTFAWLAFQPFAFFLLLVEELLVIGDAAINGIGFWAKSRSGRFHLVRELECVADRGVRTGCSTLLSPTTRTWGAVISSLIRCGLLLFSVENRVLEASVSVNCYSRESMVAAEWTRWCCYSFVLLKYLVNT